MLQLLKRKILPLVSEKKNVCDVQYCTHVHICDDAKLSSVVTTFTDWLITVTILSRKEFYEAFLYVEYVNDSMVIFACLRIILRGSR